MNEQPSRDAAPAGAVSIRIRVAELLAFVAVIAALVGAVGPAEKLSTTYSWPPAELPGAAPSDVWYTPLLLQRRFPESLDATLPCTASPVLAAAETPGTVLATARSPERAGGLAVRREGDRLSLAIGDTFFGYLPLASDRLGGVECAYRLTIADKRWSVTGGPDAIERSDDLERMPVVNGLFSALDLTAGAPLAVEIETEVHGVDPVGRQAVAWIVAALCLVAALLLVAFDRRPSWPRVRTLLASAHPVDAAIAVLLLGWWVLSPVFWDDGWTMARQEAFGTTRGFSNYYDSFGTPLPLGYWLEWLQHWLTQSTTATLVLRVPALLCLAATWLFARWLLGRVLLPHVNSVVLWALAASFAVGAMAWGMTLRLEPVMAVLVTAVMACAIRFVESPSAAWAAAVAVLVPLAITAHPVGVISLAPLILLAPAILRWLRPRAAVATTIATSAVALLVTLAFVGSDVGQRSADAQIISEASTTVVTWRDEVTRYDVFSDVRSNEFDGYGTPLRRASVALIALALLAWVVRLRRREAGSLDYLPTATLTLSLVLLVTTPSKWPWHLGALIGVLAVAVAVESAALRRSAGSSRRRALVVGVATLAIAWSWAPQHPWNTLDLRTLDWARPFEELPLVAAAVALPLLGFLGLFAAHARRDGDADARLSAFVPWTLPVLLLPMIMFTLAFLVADTAATSSWTFTRQTLDGVRGDAGCGLADDLLTPSERTVRPVRASHPEEPRALPDWVPPAPVDGLSRLVLQATAEGTARSPWFDVPPDRRIAFYLAGAPRPFDRIGLEWGRAEQQAPRSVGYDVLELLADAQANAVLAWRLVTSGELPTPPEGARSFRVVLRTEAPLGSAVVLTPPVTFSHEPMTRRLESGGARSLVQPNVRMYVPCAEHARLTDGAAEVPSTIITTPESISPVRFDSSPFAGVLDLYRLDRVSLADSVDPADELVVFGVDTRILGGGLAPATVRSS